MEGLQDALEEAHYMCALNGGRLDATSPLPDVNEEEIEDYMEKMRLRDPDAFTMGTICRETLGFYLVSLLSCCLNFII